MLTASSVLTLPPLRCQSRLLQLHHSLRIHLVQAFFGQADYCPGRIEEEHLTVTLDSKVEFRPAVNGGIALWGNS